MKNQITDETKKRAHSGAVINIDIEMTCEDGNWSVKNHQANNVNIKKLTNIGS